MEHDGRTGAVLIREGHSRVRTVACTGSTNADLIEAALLGAAEGSWLRAERQEAGRGRQGRVWASPMGNLYASTLVRLRAGDPPPATLALVAAVALHDAIAVVQPGAVGLKWPNDLLMDGAKLSGILLERVADAIVIGFGVNVAHHPDLPDRATTSLAEHGAVVSPDVLLDMLIEAFDRWLGRWRQSGIAPVRTAWLDRAHPIGTALTARLPDGTSLEGIFDGLDETGALHLRLAGGERRVIHAGDVFLIQGT